MADEPAPKALRICIDVNVWVAYVMTTQNNRTGISAQAVIAFAREMKLGGWSVQLIVSLEIADTRERVLT